MRTIQICGAGRAGDGTNTNILTLGQALKDQGAWVFIWREEVYSNIQTRDSAFGLRAADGPVFGPDDEFDILQAFDRGALVDVVGEGRVPPIARLRNGGVLLYDSSPRLDYPNTGYEIKPELVSEVVRGRGDSGLRPAHGPDRQRSFKRYILRGSIAVGVLSHLLGIPEEAFIRRFRQSFGGEGELFNLNEQAILLGRRHAEEQGWEVAGHEARVHARRAGRAADHPRQRGRCGWVHRRRLPRLRRLPDYARLRGPGVHGREPATFGGAIIQADSEMAAAHHVIGGAVAGARSMTATAGPGFSLMQEAISAAGITETPMVIVVCQRGGPATGLPTRLGQEELNETVFGGHGDIARIVLAASEPEDGFYIMGHVFNLAERYQCPVFLLLDQILAQSSYTVPALDPSGFVIDRGKLLDASAAGSDTATTATGRRYKRYELTEDGISPRIAGNVRRDQLLHQHQRAHGRRLHHGGRGDPPGEDGQALHPAHGADTRRPRAAAAPRLRSEEGAHRLHRLRLGLRSDTGRHGATGREGSRASSWSCAPSGRSPAGKSSSSPTCDSSTSSSYSAGAQLRGLIQREATGPMPRSCGRSCATTAR